mgnify:CR=1 FL=1
MLVPILSLIATSPNMAHPSFSSVNGSLYVDEKPLQLKGVNWYGFETQQGVFHGLFAQPPSIFLNLLQTNGFNAVRIPLDVDLMLHDRKHGFIKPEAWEANSTNCSHLDSAPADSGNNLDSASAESSVEYCPSHLMRNTSLETLDWFVDALGAHGVLVLFDMHCLSTAGTDASPVFFDASHPVDSVLKAWSTLARRFAGRWNVLGADVFNEPFGATWAMSAPTDMDAFATRAAAAIHAEAADWLIFVEGAAHSPNCSSTIDGDQVECGYGDNLLGVQQHPVVLPVAGKLVYSVHTYGPSQHDRPEFHNANFPTNMPDVWEQHWGYVTSLPNAPAVVLGEWGGPTDGANGQWMEALVAYLQGKQLQSNFFWALNEDGSPRGIITDWTTTPISLDQDKLTLLAQLTPQPTAFTPPSPFRDF